MSALLTIGRMARRLGVSGKWLREESDAGRLPHVKAGEQYLFVPEVVETTIARRASEPAPSMEPVSP